MKEWRSGEQREINNRAKCEDHGHSFQQTLLKTVRERGREWDRSRPRRPGTAQVRHKCACLCVCNFASVVHEISECLTWLLYAAFEMHWVHI